MTIRRAQPIDANALASLLIRSIRELCGPDYDMDESLIGPWCANKTPENMLAWMANPNSYFIVVEDEGMIRGTGNVTKTGHIVLCYLLPGEQGKGYGAALLNAMIEFARESGVAEMTLESTRTAREFYLHHGFDEVDEVKCAGSVPGYKMSMKLG